MCAGMLAATRSWAGQRMDCLMASGGSTALLTLWFRHCLWIFGSGNTREFISVIASHCVCGNLLLQHRKGMYHVMECYTAIK